MNRRKYIVQELTSKKVPQLTLGIREKQTGPKCGNNPLINIFVRADNKILKQMIEIINNNPQIWLESSVDLNTSKIVPKQQIFFYNEDSNCHDKISKFYEDVEFKKLQGESSYKISVQKTKFIRKNSEKTEKHAAQKRGFLEQTTRLRRQNYKIFCQKEKLRQELETANALTKINDYPKKIAQYQSKLNDQKDENNALRKTIQQMKILHTNLLKQLDQNNLWKDYKHMESTLYNQIEAKQNIFSKMKIMQKQLQEYKKK